MRRAILFVGSAGTGKSTLINKLLGKDEAEIGHHDDKDGTSVIHVYKDSQDENLSFIDTPGLDSSNFPAHVVEHVQKLKTKVMIVFVHSKRNTRINCKMQFEKILRDFVNFDAKFCFIQTFSDLNVPEYIGYKDTFPNVQNYHDSNLEFFREDAFSDEEMFHTLKANVASNKPVVRQKQGQLVVPPAKAKSTVKPFPVGIPFFLDQTSKPFVTYFLNGNPKQGKFETLCKTVIALKREGSREYQVKKLLGDANLKSIVYNLITRYNVERNQTGEDLEIQAHRIIDNAQPNAMPKFFDKYLAAKHNAAFPNEKEISPHGKCDVVEALIELARINKDISSFMVIMNELFALVDMQHMFL